MNFDMGIFGNRIQGLRKARKLSQVQLAIALNISTQYLSNMENGQRRPSIELLVHMAEYFHVSLDYLILGTSNHTDYQRQMREELAQGLQHLAIIDQLLKQLSEGSMQPA